MADESAGAKPRMCSIGRQHPAFVSVQIVGLYRDWVPMCSTHAQEAVDVWVDGPIRGEIRIAPLREA